MVHIKFNFVSKTNVTLSVEAEFRYFDGRQEWIWQQESKSSQVAGRALALLGESIAIIESKENGNLALTFSNGHRLTVLDSFKDFESYQITRLGHTIIV